MWCRLAWLAVFAALLFGGRVVSAQPLEQQLLQWQLLQERTSYHGSFIYERAGVFSTHKVWRQAGEDGYYRERFLRLNGSRLEALRTNGLLDCMTRQYQNQPLVNVPAPVSLLRRFEQQRMAEGYHVEHVSNGRVADRQTAVLLFAPRDVHRYPLEVHFDQETGVVLQSLLLNEQGGQLERFQFVEFAAVQQPDTDLVVDNCQPIAVEPQGHAGSRLEWQVGWLPAGFVQVRDNPVEQKGTSSQLFFDGLTHFSIFVAVVNSELVDVEHRQLGPTVVISRPVQVQGQNVMVTVLGEIPVATAQRVALSVELGNGVAAHD